MSELEESNLLARWLDGEAGAQGVRSVVQETIFVFRPDLAPQPNVVVSDLLDDLKTGPFASGQEDEEVQEEQEDLGELKLDFANAELNVDFEDVVSAVTKGPLTEDHKTEEADVVRLSHHTAEQRADLPSADEHVPWRYALGGFVAAACALIVLLPTNYELPSPSDNVRIPYEDKIDLVPSELSSKNEKEELLVISEERLMQRQQIAPNVQEKASEDPSFGSIPPPKRSLKKSRKTEAEMVFSNDSNTSNENTQHVIACLGKSNVFFYDFVSPTQKCHKLQWFFCPRLKNAINYNVFFVPDSDMK